VQQAISADLLTRRSMPNFTYVRDIPDAPHNPSVDQPDMKINTNSIDDLLLVDHYSFNDANNRSGYHKIIHQPAQTLDPAPIGGLGQFYPKVINGQITAFYQSDTGTVFNVVNKSLSGLVTLNAITPSVTLPGIIPDNCIGFLFLSNPLSLTNDNSYSFSFCAFNGTLDTQSSPAYLPAINPLVSFPINQLNPLVFLSPTGTAGSLQLILTRIGNNLTNAAWRYIYWPTL